MPEKSTEEKRSFALMLLKKMKRERVILITVAALEFVVIASLVVLLCITR